MHRFVALLCAVNLAVANPVPRAPATIKLTHVSNAKSAQDLVAQGQARLRHINKDETHGNVDASSGSVTNTGGSYVASVDIGGSLTTTPTYSLIVDTGSSNTWCGAQNSCEPSSNGQDTGDSISVGYGSGSFSGEEYQDSVGFGGLTADNQGVGAASSATGFTGVDGIIGFGPVDLTQNTVQGQDEVPTFMDTLYQQGSISQEVLGVSFAPESGSDSDDTNGELTLGGIDSSKYSGSITYFPKASSGSNAPYWGATPSGFKYGSRSLGGSGAACIVDTGTTLIYLPNSVYNSLASASGGSTDQSSGLLAFKSKPTGTWAVTIGGTSFTLTPSQYLVPQAQYSSFGLSSGKYYAYFVGGGSSGVDCIIGQKFLENYYSVYDTTNSRIGFAPRA